jgi:hypothetical protein
MGVRSPDDTDTVGKVAVAEVPPQDSLDKVEAWRLHQLLRAGWELEHAQVIAILTDVDLHVACRIVQQGCSSELAFSIFT